MSKFVHKELSYRIIGLLYDVYNELGPGLKEQTYDRTLKRVLTKENIKFQNQVYIPIKFKDDAVGSYFLDFLIEDLIVLELKVGNYFSRHNIDQVHRYLIATKLKLGILSNFTRSGVRIKRVVNLK